MNKWELCEPENWHYAASVFPLLSREELEALATDIKTNGLLNPIIRCEGKVLDGRNRMLACRLVQKDPRFRDIPKESAVAWTLSQNLFRRHLKPEEEALAIHFLESKENVKLDNILGKDRERAYKKLARLKHKFTEWAETLPENYADQVKQLLGNKAPKEEASSFEALFNRLNALVPTCSDGVEHVTVTLLETVCSTPRQDYTQADKDFLQSIVPLLERVAKDFSAYADKLRSKSPAPS
jgi:hypothetical protein